MNEIVKESLSRVIAGVIILLLISVCLNYLFGGDDSGTQERIDNIAEHSEETKSEINRVIIDLEESRERVERIEAGNSRAQELIAEIQRDLDEAERIITRALNPDKARATETEAPKDNVDGYL